MSPWKQLSTETTCYSRCLPQGLSACQPPRPGDQVEEQGFVTHGAWSGRESWRWRMNYTRRNQWDETVNSAYRPFLTQRMQEIWGQGEGKVGQRTWPKDFSAVPIGSTDVNFKIARLPRLCLVCTMGEFPRTEDPQGKPLGPSRVGAALGSQPTWPPYCVTANRPSVKMALQIHL